MSYLDRLKRVNSEKHAPKELPKQPKAPYGSFDSTQGGHSQKIATDAATLADLETAAIRLCDAYGDNESQRAEMLADVRKFPPERWPWLIEYLNDRAAQIEQTLPGNDDDRRRCTECANFAQGGRCLAAWRGQLERTARQYRPVPDLLRRCEGYAPTASSC